jgi:signal transduction histidine kinase/CHASE1-domain containing sensor protein/ActR/RegA family two-component response regulator
LNRSRQRRVFLPYLILLLGLCFTILVYYNFSKLTHDQDQSRFKKSTQEIHDNITLRVQTSMALLRAGTGLFAASNRVTKDEFDRFVQQIQLEKNYAGIHGIGFSRCFSSPEELTRVVDGMKQSGFPDFHVWPDYARDEYHAIVYLQPQNTRNRAAMGYDMFTEAVRREAMEKARDTGMPAASGRVTLVQEKADPTNQQAGFLIYAPVYRKSGTPSNKAELRSSLLGFVYSPYRVDDFLKPITEQQHFDVSFRVYDGAEQKPDNLLYDSRDADPSHKSRFTSFDTEDVAGRSWTIAYATKPSFEAASNQPFVKYTLFVGTLLSLLFFAVSRAQVLARMSAERAAADLKESESTVRKSLAQREKAEDALREADLRALLEYERLLARISLLAQALGTVRELNAIFRALREFTDVSVPCDGFFVSLYDAVRDVRTACYGWGDGSEVDVSELPPMPVTAHGPNSRAVRTGEVVITDNYMNAQRGHPTVVVGSDNGLRPETSMAVPMAVMGRIIGTIEVQSYQAGVYRPEHVTAMSMAANLTAVAIENVRLLKLERTARQAAEESNRLKDEFLATVSHELRTPLTAILGWSRLLEDGSVDDEVSKQAIETICRNAKAQAQIVDDILDVSRIITGNLYLDLHPVQLAPVVKNAINVVRPTADAKGIKIDARIDATPAMVSGDANRLQQVIWNLLSNAVKFTYSGGRVMVRLSQVRSNVEITVSDTGQGISREFMPYVFDRFRQADSTTTRHHGGLGLGLAIARHLVEIHGGTIKAESDGEGRGATFTITLPIIETAVKQAAPLADTREHRKAVAAVAPQLLSGVNVLLVDDDSDTLKLMTTALTRRQATVTAVSSAGEAIEAIRQHRPDVLVSDIAMPDEDGYGLIEKVRSLEAGDDEGIPAVAITAYAKEEDREKALSSGFQIYLAKPVELTELISVVARAARRDF